MILDTGVLFAAADARDRTHAAARRALQTPGPKIIPEPVIAEAAYFIGTRLGVDNELAFLDSLDSFFAVEPIIRRDRSRAKEIIARYRDTRIGYVDATTVAVAERLGIRTIATLDRRHFTLVKPRHIEAFELLP